MNRDLDAQKLDLPTPETLGELEQHVQRQLNGRVREFRLSLRDAGLVLEGCTCTYQQGSTESYTTYCSRSDSNHVRARVLRASNWPASISITLIAHPRSTRTFHLSTNTVHLTLDAPAPSPPSFFTMGRGLG